MKSELLLTCSLLVSLSVLVKCDAETQKTDFKGLSSSREAKITCPEGYSFFKKGKYISNVLEYKDINSGEYECKNGSDAVKIFVKFRTCDNCIELDYVSAAGLIVGEVVVTFVIGVSVFLIAKRLQTGTAAPNKKGSDKQRLVPNEMSNDDGNYQKLTRSKNVIYDKLRN